MQDLPQGGRGDAVAEPDQLTLHAPVSPGRILGCYPDGQLLDRCCGGRTSGLAMCGVVPFPRDQPTVPRPQRGPQ